MKIIPAIDLIGGKTVRLKQGDYNQKLSYDIDPVIAACNWFEAGASLIHVIDLDGAKEGKPMNLEVIKKIEKKVSVPIEVGGGYRTKEDINRAIEIGVSRVIVGSRAFEDPEFAGECISEYGEQFIISADASNLQLRVEGWEKDSAQDFFEILNKFADFGVREIIYTDIQKDGMLTGPAIDNILKILSAVDIKIISAGGIKNIDDIKKLKEIENKGVTGVIVGRALYEGTIDLKEAIDVG